MSRTAWLAPLVVMLAACGGTAPSPTEPPRLRPSTRRRPRQRGSPSATTPIRRWP